MPWAWCSSRMARRWLTRSTTRQHFLGPSSSIRSRNETFLEGRTRTSAPRITWHPRLRRAAISARAMVTRCFPATTIWMIQPTKSLRYSAIRPRCRAEPQLTLFPVGFLRHSLKQTTLYQTEAWGTKNSTCPHRMRWQGSTNKTCSLETV